MELCCVCGTALNKCNTVWAAKGKLYCSEECGLKEHEDFKDVAEEVVTASIGITSCVDALIEYILLCNDCDYETANLAAHETVAEVSKLVDKALYELGYEANRVVEILCRRDKLTREEAEKKLEEVRQMISEVNYNYDEVEEIMSDELGLEMDYIHDVI